MTDWAAKAYQRTRAGGERILFCYLVIFVLSRIHETWPLGSTLTRWLRRPWEIAVPWFGQHVLRLEEPVSIALSSSRDRPFDWVQVALMLSLALLVAAIWTSWDRTPNIDGAAREIARVAIRYGLGTAMLAYGASKLILEQMPAPNLATLVEPIGHLSPMRLLWVFMGHSPAYNIFAGTIEAAGGALLLFRRTSILGALLLFPLLVNVLLINLCYGVPVKLNAAHYVLMAIVLAAPSVGPVLNLLVRDRTARARPAPWPWENSRMALPFTVTKWVITVGVLVLIPGQRVLRYLRTPMPVKSELFGLYAVESFARDGQPRPPLLTDAERWRYVAIDLGDVATIMSMNDERLVFQIRRGSRAGMLILQSRQSSNAPEEEFTYEPIPPHGLALSGRIDGTQVDVRLVPADERSLRLLRDRFHWVSERPSYR